MRKHQLVLATLSLISALFSPIAIASITRIPVIIHYVSSEGEYNAWGTDETFPLLFPKSLVGFATIATPTHALEGDTKNIFFNDDQIIVQSAERTNAQTPKPEDFWGGKHRSEYEIRFLTPHNDLVSTSPNTTLGNLSILKQANVYYWMKQSLANMAALGFSPRKQIKAFIDVPRRTTEFSARQIDAPDVRIELTKNTLSFLEAPNEELVSHKDWDPAQLETYEIGDDNTPRSRPEPKAPVENSWANPSSLDPSLILANTNYLAMMTTRSEISDALTLEPAIKAFADYFALNLLQSGSLGQIKNRGGFTALANNRTFVHYDMTDAHYIQVLLGALYESRNIIIEATGSSEIADAIAVRAVRLILNDPHFMREKVFNHYKAALLETVASGKLGQSAGAIEAKLYAEWETNRKFNINTSPEKQVLRPNQSSLESKLGLTFRITESGTDDDIAAMLDGKINEHLFTIDELHSAGNSEYTWMKVTIDKSSATRAQLWLRVNNWKNYRVEEALDMELRPIQESSDQAARAAMQLLQTETFTRIVIPQARNRMGNIRSQALKDAPYYQAAIKEVFYPVKSRQSAALFNGKRVPIEIQTGILAKPGLDSCEVWLNAPSVQHNFELITAPSNQLGAFTQQLSDDVSLLGFRTIEADGRSITMVFEEVAF